MCRTEYNCKRTILAVSVADAVSQHCIYIPGKVYIYLCSHQFHLQSCVAMRNIDASYLRCFDIQGGLKAAITADAIQGTVLILVSVLISIQGAYETGNVKDVYNINKENGKLK